MLTLSNHCGQVTGGRALARKRIWLRILVLAGLGAMALAVLCLLPGCGSDSTPEGSVKGKNAKTAGAGAKKSAAVIPLLTDKEGTDPDKLKISQKPPDAKRLEVVPGITREEMEAKVAADRARFDPKQMEAFPRAGITVADLEAKVAADRARFDPKQIEAFPKAGITMADLEAKVAADRARFDPKQMEAFPKAGITMAQLEAKVAADRANIEPRVIPPPPIGTPQKESNLREPGERTMPKRGGVGSHRRWGDGS